MYLQVQLCFTRTVACINTGWYDRSLSVLKACNCTTITSYILLHQHPEFPFQPSLSPFLILAGIRTSVTDPYWGNNYVFPCKRVPSGLTPAAWAGASAPPVLFAPSSLFAPSISPALLDRTSVECQSNACASQSKPPHFLFAVTFLLRKGSARMHWSLSRYPSGFTLDFGIELIGCMLIVDGCYLFFRLNLKRVSFVPWHMHAHWSWWISDLVSRFEGLFVEHTTHVMSFWDINRVSPVHFSCNGLADSACHNSSELISVHMRCQDKFFPDQR